MNLALITYSWTLNYYVGLFFASRDFDSGSIGLWSAACNLAGWLANLIAGRRKNSQTPLWLAPFFVACLGLALFLPNKFWGGGCFVAEFLLMGCATSVFGRERQLVFNPHRSSTQSSLFDLAVKLNMNVVSGIFGKTADASTPRAFAITCGTCALGFILAAPAYLRARRRMIAQ